MSGKPRILIVDDEEIVRLNIERILERDYEVKSVESAEEALQLFSHEDFDLILTDLVMEEMDGLKFLEEVKRYRPELVVIVITGYGSMPSAISAMQRGAYDYILKPCSKEELLARVRKGLEKEKADKRLIEFKKMETILSNVGVFIIDNKGMIISAQNSLKDKIWGKTEIIGQKLFSLPYLEETDIKKDFSLALLGEGVERERVRILGDDSRGDVVVSYHLKPMDYKKGQVNSLIWIVEDITKRTRIMQQISQAEKLTSLGKLAAGVAHEINNPLNIISLDVEYVKGQLNPDSPLQENLNSISEEVERIARIVQQLQEQTRTQESLYEGSNLEEILNNHIFKIVFAQLEKKGVKVKLNLEKNQGDLLVPKSKLTQVLMNLVKNAEEAMPEGGTITLTSSTISSENWGGNKGLTGAKEDKVARIILSDTGQGIKKEHRSNIFEPFFTTKGFEGTGLGLFISYTIIKGYHGDIQVESQENKGTTFTITLPLAKVGARV